MKRGNFLACFLLFLPYVALFDSDEFKENEKKDESSFERRVDVPDVTCPTPFELGYKFDFILTKYGIEPDVIPYAPTDMLNVTYSEGVTVRAGNELTPTATKNIPISVIWSAKPNSFYTICMTDPDDPKITVPLFGEWQHWLVVNIPGTNVKAGDILTEYVGPIPADESDLHRYVFVAYEQPGKLKFNETYIDDRTEEGRSFFKIFKFAEKYGMGLPVAANFFLAGYDESVLVTYKQLGRPVQLDY